MRRNYLLTLTISLLIVFSLSVSGVMASWRYLGNPTGIEEKISSNFSAFRYGTLYITKVETSSGNYEKAEGKKAADLDISADIILNATSSSTATLSVVLYNNTDVSYYFNEAQTLSHSNNAIIYSVGGIQQKDEILPKTYKTITVTYSFDSGVSSSKELLSKIHFSFVIDKDSIGEVVAQTAVDRFRDILNNKVAPDSYDTLDTAMDNRGSLFNKASAVTYIGNVSGSSSSDSKVIETLFGQEFMSMDLDGDGKAEPITMMIKREDLDNNSTTGASYTYTNRGQEVTVDGAEMTLYITSENLNNVSNNKKVSVYAAVFSKSAESEEWVQIMPLTKGTASANNYNGYGSANSFNTDTWVSLDGQNIETLVAQSNK